MSYTPPEVGSAWIPTTGRRPHLRRRVVVESFAPHVVRYRRDDGVERAIHIESWVFWVRYSGAQQVEAKS